MKHHKLKQFSVNNSFISTYHWLNDEAADTDALSLTDRNYVASGGHKGEARRQSRRATLVEGGTFYYNYANFFGLSKIFCLLPL